MELKDHIKNVESLYKKDAIVRFITSKSTYNEIMEKKSFSKKEKRNFKLDTLLADDGEEYQVVTEQGLVDLPSQFYYYDTYTKKTCKWERYNYILKELDEMGYKPSKWNLGPEYEQSFSLKIGSFISILNLKTNMFYSLKVMNENIHKNIIMNKFFNMDYIENSILEYLPLSEKRNRKLNSLLT